ncbi:ribbon-helix-helix protein, CopG family [Sphaerisporangium melleum]|nr:CopG family transcriptional regulator [Sphaerisporangium melleum]
MKRTTVELSDDLDARVRHEAERRGMTVSAWTREAIEAHLSDQGRRRCLTIGAGQSGEDAVAARIHDMLGREWSDRSQKAP